ncbi:MAG: hypothetical protein ABI831_01840, partial [Betaproteobacteria bacterium]
MEEEAVAAWQRWSVLHPDAAAANAVIGSALAQMHRWADAEAALTLVADSADLDGSAASRLAFVRRERGDIDGARTAFALALRRSPSALTPRVGTALLLPQIYQGIVDLRRWRAQYDAGLAGLEADLPGMVRAPQALWALEWSNFYLAYQGEDDLALQRRYAGLIATLAHSAAEVWSTPPAPMPRGKRRLRVGFASSFFRDCTVAAYFGSWITGLDRACFESFLFHFGSDIDATTLFLRSRVDHAVLMDGGVHGIAAKIRAASLDVLVYPQLGMDGRDATLAALRLAPVQCAAWGHPVTTGSAA